MKDRLYEAFGGRRSPTGRALDYQHRLEGPPQHKIRPVPPATAATITRPRNSFHFSSPAFIFNKLGNKKQIQNFDQWE